MTKFSAPASIPAVWAPGVCAEGDGSPASWVVPTSNTSVCAISQRPRRAGWAHTPADLPQTGARFGAKSCSGIRGKPGTLFSFDVLAAEGIEQGAAQVAAFAAPTKFQILDAPIPPAVAPCGIVEVAAPSPLGDAKTDAGLLVLHSRRLASFSSSGFGVRAMRFDSEPWFEDDDRRLIKLRCLGLSTSLIGDLMDRTKNSIISRLRALGFSTPSAARKPTRTARKRRAKPDRGVRPAPTWVGRPGRPDRIRLPVPGEYVWKSKPRMVSREKNAIDETVLIDTFDDERPNKPSLPHVSFLDEHEATAAKLDARIATLEAEKAPAGKARRS